MGVHISRVKSVDLDSWTDEQLASMLRWGNGRANKYWEDKLAPGHVPNEAKIENFIRTKYDSKRWVMDGPMPDPSTLSDAAADDDVPLNVVREKANMERSGSIRNGSSSVGNLPQPPRKPQVDLFGDMEEAAPARPSTTEPAIRAGNAKAPAAPPKQTRAGESLLGMDFFGSSQSAPPRPSSAASGMTTPAASGRVDLKNSILSLYASAPKPAAAAPQTQHRQQPSTSNVDFFGDMQSPTASAQPAAKSDPFAGMSSARAAPSKPQSSNLDLFGGMQSPPLTSPVQPVQPQANYKNFSGMQSAPPTTAAPKPQLNADLFGSMQSPPLPAASSFSGLTSPTGHTQQKSSLSGGSFFDPKPAPPPKDLSPPRQQAMPAPVPAQAKNSTFGMDSLSISGANSNPWGNDNAWAQPDPTPAPAPAPAKAQPKAQPPQAPQPVQDDDDFGGWSHASPLPTPTAAPAPQQQEDFGGWSHASPVRTAATPATAPKQNFGGGQDDLFGNVWG